MAKLAWNSRDHKFTGHVMTEEEMSSLCDVYQTLDPERKTACTHYILQTVWRDLSSKYDVLGPYFTSQKGFESKFLIVSIHETMLKFHWYGFHTAVIVVMGLVLI